MLAQPSSDFDHAADLDIFILIICSTLGAIHVPNQRVPLKRRTKITKGGCPIVAAGVVGD